MKQEFKIKDYGIFTTVILTTLGINVFTYPRYTSDVINTEGWIVTIIACFISIFFLSVIIKSIELSGFKDFHTIIKENFGKIFGSIILLLFMLHNIGSSCIGLRVFGEVLKMHLLQKTPIEVIIILFILTSTFIVRGGLDSIIKFNEIIFWVAIIPIGLTIFLTIYHADFTNIFPMLANPPISYLKGVQVSLFSFIQGNIIYILIPYIENKENTKKVIIKSQIFIAVFYIIITIFSLAVFGSEEVKQLLWPTITMIKSIDIPGSFVERWEGIIMVFWILFLFASFINSYYFSSYILNNVLNLSNNKLTTSIIAPIYYILSLSIENIGKLYEVRQGLIYKLGSMIIFILPLVIYMVVKVRQKGEVKNEK